MNSLSVVRIIIVLLVVIAALFFVLSRNTKAQEVPKLTIVNKSGVHCIVQYPDGCRAEGLCADLLGEVQNRPEGVTALKSIQQVACSTK